MARGAWKGTNNFIHTREWNDIFFKKKKKKEKNDIIMRNLFMWIR